MPMPKFSTPDLNATDREDGHEQFPVDTFIGKVTFKTSLPAGDLLRMVVMSDHSTAHYSTMHEHHHGNTHISLDDLTSFTLESGAITSGQQSDIEAFVSPLSLCFSVPQVAPWFRGVYTPTGAQKRLYKATDPDDSTRLIGVLLEQDEDNQLTQMTWYKAQESQVIFQSTPQSLDFTLVLDGNGNPSTDPSDMGGWTWYHCPSV